MQKRLLFYILVFSLFLTMNAPGQTPPKTVKIGYFQGGQYFFHKILTTAIKAELAEMAGDSIQIIFEPYAYRSAEWRRDICKSYGRDFARMKGIDMVIAAGPWVVEDLIEAGYKGAIIAIHQFDPFLQGLIDRTGRPIVENLTVNYHPGKIESDLETIQKLFSPRRIGFLYFSSADESDRVKSKLALAADRFNANIISSEELTPEGDYSFFKSFGNIRDNIDVLYLPPMWGIQVDQMRQFFVETFNARVPTFTSEGFLILEKGATAGNCIRPDLPLGRFTAYKMIQIITGASPASLPTVIDEAPAMCLNLESARKLNINFSRKHINNAKTVPAAPNENTPIYTFSEAIQQGLRENVSLLRGGAVYEKALVAAGNAWSRFYPEIRVGAAAAASDNEAEAAVYNDRLNREFMTEIVLDQKLFSYPAVKAVSIAKKNLEIEKTSLEQARLDLKHSITVAYLSVIENEEKVDLIKEKIDRLRRYWEMTLTDSYLGYCDTLDVLVIQERLVAAKMMLHDAASGLKIARVILNVLISRPGDDLVVLNRDDFAPELMVLMARKFESYTVDAASQKKFEDYLVNVGIANSSEMQMAALSIGIQRDLISQHNKRYIPELTLRGKYSYSNEFEPEYGRKDDTWTVGAYLNLPLLSGASRKNRGEALQAGMNELFYEKDMIRFGRMQDIVTAVEKLVALVSTLPMSYFAKNLAEDNLDAAYLKFKQGHLSSVELITLEENAAAMDQNLLYRKFDFFTSYAEMLNAVGVGYLIRDSREEIEFFGKFEESLEF